MGALNFITTTDGPARQGHDAWAPAADVLDLVRHRDPWLAGLRRAAGRVHPAAAGSHGRHQLLHSRRLGGHRSSRSPGTRAARRCCGSTCSGSSAIPRSTSRFCPAWAWLRTCSPRSRASRFSVTGRWSCAICGIGFLGFCVWGHHMFVSGMSPYSAFAFSILTMTIGVPSAIKTFNWLGTLWGGKIQFNCAMLFALGLCFAVRDRRTFRPVPGAAVAGPLLARHLFRGRALPPDHGRGGDLRHVRGDCISGSRRCLAGC